MEKKELMVPRNLFVILRQAGNRPHGTLPKIQLPNPVFDIKDGAIKANQKITITCAVKKATIRYTTDGNDPTESSAVYSDPVAISQSATLKAKAFKTGWTSSDIKSASYTIE
jgi:chitinase